MLASSWKRKDLVRAAWLRLDVPKGHREKLSELTGIPAPNLSGMNTGRLPMTPEIAERICAAVPGLTLADLGATEAAGGEEGRPLTLHERLGELEGDLAESVSEQAKTNRAVSALQARVRKLEARLAQGQGAVVP